MKRIGTPYALYLSLWHGLLAIACIILIYLSGVPMSEALKTSSSFTFFNTNQAFLTWEPSRGAVDHYVLEITDTRLIGGASSAANRYIRTSHATSVLPTYRLECSHNHSYQVRIKAISPTGAASEYSEPSILFICDQQPPTLRIDHVPALKKVRSHNITVTGSFDEPNLASISLNDSPASIDYQSKTFRATHTLTPGENTIRFCARDLAGNVSTETLIITYAPINIISLPGDAALYWNGNYAYSGRYGGTTPHAYNYAGQHKQTLRISLPGFQDYCGVIDFSDLSRDSYVISLTPHALPVFTRLAPLVPNDGNALLLAYAHPFVVDYNLDGKKDLLVGNGDGTIRLYLNRGTNTAPVLSDYLPLNTDDGPLDAGTNAAPFMVDLDDNGIFDLLVGNGDGLLYCYTNKGSNAAPAFGSPHQLTAPDGTPISVESNCKPWVADWNRDGTKELLLGSGSGTLALSRNQGSDRHPRFSSPRPLMAGGEEIQVDGPSAPCVVDWNADGQLDVLLGMGNGHIHVYYAAPGAEEEPEITRRETIELNGQAIMLEGAVVLFPVDWNEDGRTELLLGTEEGEIYLAL